MITDHLYVLAMDKYGAVYVSGVKYGESQPEIAIGGSMPISVPFDQTVLDGLVIEMGRRFGHKVSEPEPLGTMQHEGKTYYVSYYYCDVDLGRRSDNRFLHRWYVERHLDYISPLSRMMWELIRRKSFDRWPLNSKSSLKALLDPPKAARRNGQLEALEQMTTYARRNEGVSITVGETHARLVAGDGEPIDEPRPVCIDSLFLGGD